MGPSECSSSIPQTSTHAQLGRSFKLRVSYLQLFSKTGTHLLSLQRQHG